MIGQNVLHHCLGNMDVFQNQPIQKKLLDFRHTSTMVDVGRFCWWLHLFLPLPLAVSMFTMSVPFPPTLKWKMCVEFPAGYVSGTRSEIPFPRMLHKLNLTNYTLAKQHGTGSLKPWLLNMAPLMKSNTPYEEWWMCFPDFLQSIAFWRIKQPMLALDCSKILWN